jgi:hypothetical protein
VLVIAALLSWLGWRSSGRLARLGDLLIAVIAVGVFGLAWRRRGRTSEPPAPVVAGNVAAERDAADVDLAARRAKRMAKLAALAEQLSASAPDDAETRALVRERLGSLASAWGGDEGLEAREGLACLSGDFYDELGWLKAAGSAGASGAAIAQLRAELTGLLADLGAELLRREQWDPAVQRAVSVERTTEPLPGPKILRFGRSGLTVDGKLLRKQEVAILQN